MHFPPSSRRRHFSASRRNSTQGEKAQSTRIHLPSTLHTHTHTCSFPASSIATLCLPIAMESSRPNPQVIRDADLLVCPRLRNHATSHVFLIGAHPLFHDPEPGGVEGG